MANVRLHPLSLGEVLDRTFSHYREHFLLFVGIMALPQVFIIGLNVLFQIVQSTAAGPVRTAQPTTAAPSGFVASSLIALAVFLVAYFLVYSTALGATTYALSEVHLGHSTTIRSAYRVVRQKLGRLFNVAISVLIRILGVILLVGVVMGILAAIVTPVLSRSMGAAGGVLTGLGMFFVFIAAAILGVILVLRYSVAVPALLLENVSARQAIKRSVLLSKGYLWRLFVVALLMGMIGFVVGLLFQAPFAIAIFGAAFKGHRPELWLSIASVVSGGVGNAITAPLLVIGWAVAYYDMRVRKEGFDLQLMMSELDSAGTGATAAGQDPTQRRAALEDASVFEAVLLTLFTAGIYLPVWFMLRRKALNGLRSPEKLGLLPLIAALVLFTANVVLMVRGSYIWGSWVQAENAMGPVSPLILLVAGIVLLVSGFKVQRILQDHVRSRSPSLFSSGISLQPSFSCVATFFFGIFYLQYEINRWVGAWAPEGAVAIPNPVVPPPTPAIPSVTS